ncbi:MAG TPA: class I SAM-dependent methyltransferase [Euzebyales bacterium]|nr:class I SAM-dependent methyltransferase [Euzebyales bacterium]
MTAPLDASAAYPLGRSDAETRRLILQHQIYGPFTRQLFGDAGITAGMHVLDVGSGAGDVALLLAELVGPQGHVTGVDTNPEILEVARGRAAAAHRTNVVFHSGDVRQLDLRDGFDAVVGRWVLMYEPDPVATVGHVAGLLQAGGIVAFQEMDLSTPRSSYPPAPLHDQVLRWTTPSADTGPDIAMGMKLFSTYRRAGLPAPQMRIDVPAGGGADWPGYAYIAATVHSLLPFLEQQGAVARDEVDETTLEERLRAEIIDRDGMQILPAIVGAWTRV